MLQKDRKNQEWIKTACNTLKGFVDDIGEKMQYVLKDSESLGRICGTLMLSPDGGIKKLAFELLNRLLIAGLQVCGLELSEEQTAMQIDSAHAQQLSEIADKQIGEDRVLKITSRIC